jgi:membrane associated rhomboid family serine protease
MIEDRSYMREPDWRPATGGGSTPMWGMVIIANVVCFALQFILDRNLVGSLMMRPSAIAEGHVYQLITFQLLHGDLLHILFNCLIIWWAGKGLEERIGKWRLLAVYLTAGVAGGLFQCGLAWAEINPGGPMVGASAGASGLIAGFALLYWEREITLMLMLIIPVRMRCKWLLAGLAVIALLGILTQTKPSTGGGAVIAHGAHLGGLIWGILFIFTFIQGGTWSGAEPWMERLRDRFGELRSNRRKVVTIDGGARAYSREQGGLTEVETELSSKEIDRILEKISEKGIHSLTDDERKALERARQNMMR